jgi:hypothetical protein
VWIGVMTYGGIEHPTTLTLAQTENALSGEWNGFGPDGGDVGAVVGMYRSDGSISMTWRSKDYYNCSLGVTATLAPNGTLSGPYSVEECSSQNGRVLGAVALKRQ